MNIPYSLAAAITLAILLALSCWALKSEIGRNAELSQAVEIRDASIKRLSDAAKQAELERQRLDSLLSVRDTAKAASEGKANTGKAVVRVASQQPTRFGACSTVNVPADIIDRLRNTSGRDTDRKAVPATSPAKRISATYYSGYVDNRAGHNTAL